MTIRHNWGDDRLDYRDAAGRLASIPAAWTDLVAADPVVVVSVGRSPFRLQDLLELVRLLQSLERPVGGASAQEASHG